MGAKRIPRGCTGCAFNGKKCVAMSTRMKHCFAACYTVKDLTTRYNEMRRLDYLSESLINHEYETCLNRLKGKREDNENERN